MLVVIPQFTRYHTRPMDDRAIQWFPDMHFLGILRETENEAFVTMRALDGTNHSFQWHRRWYILNKDNKRVYLKPGDWLVPVNNKGATRVD